MSGRPTLLVLATVGLLALGCGRMPNPNGPDDGQDLPDSPYLGVVANDEQPQTGGRLIYGLPAETNSWNPSVAQWGAYSLEVARALFDTLYAYDSDGNAQPNLAAGADHNEDYTEWTVHLRPGIRFHDGRPLTANDLIASNEYFRASPVIGGAYNLTTLYRAEAVDDLTFRMYSHKPWPTMRDSSTSPLSIAAPLDWLQSNDWAHPVGTGPFKIDHWDLGDSLVVTRNKDYWRRDQWGNHLPYLDSIEFRIMPNDQQRADALRAGDLDVMMQTLPTAGLTDLRRECQRGRFQCFSDEKGETPENYVVLNTSKPPFDDIDARRALAMAVDRDDYVQKVTGGVSTPADGIHTPSSPWYTPSSYPSFDPVEARRLVDEVRARHGTFGFELMGAATEEATRIMHYLEAAWTAVGINVRVVTTDNRSKIIGQFDGSYEASLTQSFDNTHPSVTMAYLDPSQTRPGQLTLVFSRLADDELAGDIETFMRSTPSMDSWRTANALVMNRLNELVPFIWLDHAPRNVIARANLVNVVRATLPDGQIAADFTGGAHGLAQIWVRRS